jgi:hypothetical protein
VGAANKNIEIAQALVEGMRTGDMDANRNFHRLFDLCLLPAARTLTGEEDREHAIGMVTLIVTLLLPEEVRTEFLAAADEDDDEE